MAVIAHVISWSLAGYGAGIGWLWGKCAGYGESVPVMGKVCRYGESVPLWGKCAESVRSLAVIAHLIGWLWGKCKCGKCTIIGCHWLVIDHCLSLAGYRENVPKVCVGKCKINRRVLGGGVHLSIETPPLLRER